MLHTPLRRSAWLSEAAGVEVLLKLETLQPTFSYKVRGAINAVERRIASESGPPRLVTASAGNHGRALAYAAAHRGIGVVVYASANAPRTKLDAIRALGADLRLCRDYDDAERAAKEHAARDGTSFVSPYNHPDVIAGAGTVGLEILEARPEVTSIVVPVGGGGLISGIALAAQRASHVKVVGAEAEASQPFTRGRAAGRIVPVEVAPTLADGLAGNLDPDTATFDIVQRLVPEIVTVSERDLEEAMRGVLERERLVAEGAGAAGVAALLGGRIALLGRCVAVVLSGANVDTNVLKHILR